MIPKAIIFDVDGTLAETEEVHRQAFNEAFSRHGLRWHWTQDEYRALLRVTGGKERIRHFCDLAGIARNEFDDGQVASLHAEKTARYVALLSEGTFDLRPGIRTLIEDARRLGCRLAIATTTSRDNVVCLLNGAFGAAGTSLFATIICGEDVKEKKPSPEAYLLTLQRLAATADACIAVEDSRNGLLSAKRAGLRVAITPSFYTAEDDFNGADWLCDAEGPSLAAIAGDP